MVVHKSYDAIVIVDASGRIIYVNNQTCVVFGYTEQELLGQIVEILIKAIVRFAQKPRDHERSIEHDQ